MGTALQRVEKGAKPGPLCHSSVEGCAGDSAASRSSLFCGSGTTDTFSSFPSLGFILLLVFQTCGTLNVAQTHSLFCASPNDCRIHGLQSLRHCLLSYLFLPGKPAVLSLAESPSATGPAPRLPVPPQLQLLPAPANSHSHFHGNQNTFPSLSTSERKALVPSLAHSFFSVCLFSQPGAHNVEDQVGLRFVVIFPPGFLSVKITVMSHCG